MSLPKECPVGPQRKRRSPKKNLEAAVVRECLQFLNQCPDVVYIERRNTGAVQFQDGGFIRFGQRGAADIWCLVKVPLFKISFPIDENREPIFAVTGQNLIRHVELEIKRSDGQGRLSQDQKKFQEFCRKVGIPYYVIINVDELMAAIEEIQCK